MGTELYVHTIAVSEEDKCVLSSKLPVWRVINSPVILHVSFSTVKLFRHGSQAIYRKTKGGLLVFTIQRCH